MYFAAVTMDLCPLLIPLLQQLYYCIIVIHVDHHQSDTIPAESPVKDGQYTSMYVSSTGLRLYLVI